MLSFMAFTPVVAQDYQKGYDAANSGEDIRPEAIARAKELLGDANWLSDYNIDGLANKLIDIENI